MCVCEKESEIERVSVCNEYCVLCIAFCLVCRVYCVVCNVFFVVVMYSRVYLYGCEMEC